MRSARRLVRRLAQLVLVLLVVTLIVFLLTQVAPGDAARIRLGPHASPEAVAQLQHQLGLDRSVPRQYVDYLGRLVRGDLGQSIDGQNVSSIVSAGLASTLWLLSGTLLLSVVASLCLAWVTAVRRDRMVDHGVRLMMLVGLFLPAFWVGFLLLRLVAIPTGWFPVAGLGDTPASLARSLVLPSVTGAIVVTPVLVRSLRSSLVDTLDAEYVAVARSLGITGPRFVVQHVLRNAVAPTIALLCLNIGYLFFGVVILEATFDIHGLGSALVSAAARQDVYTVQGITLVFAVGVVLVNLLGDYLVGALDPRAGGA